MKTYKVRNDEGKDFDVDADRLSDAEKDGYLPVVSNGKEEHRVSMADISDAEKDGFKPLGTPTKDISKLDSVLRGSVSGVFAGFGDELSGAAGYLAGKVGLVPDVGYEYYRDSAREQDRESREANPKTFLASEIGGGVVGAMAPGVGVLNAGKGAKIAEIAAKGALQGGIAGVGNSEENSVGGILKDSAIGAGTGAFLGSAAHGAGKVIGKGTKYVGELLDNAKPAEAITKKAGNLAFDIPEKHVQMMLDEPMIKRKPTSLLSIQEDVEKAVGNLRESIDDVGKGAWSKLSDKPHYPGSDLTSGIIDNELLNKKLIMSTSDGKTFASSIGKDKIAIRKAQEISEYLGSKGDLSEKDIKTLIQKIDSEIDWDKPDLDTANEVLTSVRSRLDDVLKQGNPKYKEAMEVVAPQVKLLDQASKELRLKRGSGGALEATDTTTSKLKSLKDSLGKDAKSQSKDMLARLSKYRTLEDGADVVYTQTSNETIIKGKKPDSLKWSGSPEKTLRTLDEKKNLISDLELLDLYDKTKGGIANGSRSTIAGSIAGSVLGGGLNPITAVLGAGAGYAKDKYGRTIGGAVIPKIAGAVKGTDAIIQNIAKNMKNVPEKYQQVLQNALTRGGIQAVLATHFILMKDKPDYAQGMNRSDE